MAFHSVPYHSESKREPSGSKRQEKGVEKLAHAKALPCHIPAASSHSWGLPRIQISPSRGAGICHFSASSDFLALWKLVLGKNEVRAVLKEATGPWSWCLIEILLLQVLALINASFKPILEQEGGKLMWSVRIITAREPLERGREEKWKMKAGKWFKQTLTQGQWKGGTEGKWHNKNKCCKRKKSF